MDERLYQIYQQGLLNSKYQIAENTKRVPLYTSRVQNIPRPYVITNQLDKNTGLSLYQANTQDLKFDKIICQKPPKESGFRYNYAIDNHISNKLVDVSGSVFKNSELRVQPFKNTTPAKHY